MEASHARNGPAQYGMGRTGEQLGKLTNLFLSEAGLDWQRSSEAPETYAAMRFLRGDA